MRTLADRYRLEGPIGEGGMGVVHRGVDLELERPVAVKLLASDDAGLRARFVVEARRTAAVRHPAIVEVFDVGQDGADAFLVMELLEGETLSARLEREKRMPPAEAVRIAAHMCDALAAAHDAGFVHRDLKPANVFLVGDGERVKLLDFGIAKRMDGATARTDPNVLVGTIEYMAPEQIKGGAIDGRADLYALGLTLYRAIAGVHAFSGESVATLIHKQLDVPAASMRSHGVAVSGALDAIVLRLLEKDPKRRPASARDAKRLLALALEAPLDAPRSPEGSMREIDLEAVDSSAPSLELAGGARSAGAIVPIATVPPPMPRPQAPPAPMRRAPAPLPSWAAPLARVPVEVSKRVVGYSLFVLLLWVVFFGGAWPMVVALLLVAGGGGAAMWARRRARGA